MKIRKLFLCFVALAAVFGLAACNSSVAVTGITITAKDNVREIKVDEILQLTATVFPENADVKDVTWSTSNTNFASVSDSGLVKGLSAGNVDIIATSVENESISQKYSLIIKNKDLEVVVPTEVKITAAGNATTIKVGERLTLTAVVSPQGASQSVDWTSSDPTIAQVRTGEVSALKEGKVTITATCKDTPNVKGSLDLEVVKATSSNEEFVGMPITSHADFMEAENDTKVKVKGIVTYVCPEDKSLVSYYIQNGTEGFYVYQQNATLYPVEVGKCYEVGGAKKYYQGNNEIVNVEYFKESSEKLTYTLNEVKGKDVSSLDEMKPYHNSYIKAEGMITKTPAVSEKAFSVDVVVEGKAIALRVDPKNMSAEEFSAIGNLFKNSLANTTLEFKGIMTAFGYGKASPQVQLLKASDIDVKEASPADQLAAIKNGLLIKVSLNVDVNKLTLPVNVEGFKDVSITWTSDNAAVVNAADGTVKHLEADTVVTLTATLKHAKDAELSETKSFKVIVLGTVFNHELLASLDCEDASTEGGQYGTSGTKPNYSNKDGNDVVELGTPKVGWLLKNTLIAKDNRTDGAFSLRVQNNADPTKAGRVEIQVAGEYNFVQFDGTTYNNDDPIVLGVEYLMDGAEAWVDAGYSLTMDNTLTTYRIALPEGSKRVAIYIIGADGKRANLDNIKLFK